MLKPLGFCVSLFSLKEGKKKKKQVEAFRVLRDQIETWGDREFEDCNVEGSLKGKKKKKVEAFRYCVRKTESLKATHLPALPFRSNSYLSDFLLLFLSTWFINIDRTYLLQLRYHYISILFCPIILHLGFCFPY